MNAKNAPLTPAFPNRCYRMLFLRPKNRKRALTKPTLSYTNATGEEKKQHIDEITGFVRYYLTYVRKLNPVNALTAGYEFSSQLDVAVDLEDVIGFHDYTPMWSTIEAAHRTCSALNC